MKLIISINVLAFIFLYSCSSVPTVTALCEKDARGNYTLKWEVYPDVDNVPAEIYLSENDTEFPSAPAFKANSNDYIATIDRTDNGLESRKFFRIKIGGTFSDVITNRFFEFDSIQNFRDIGGYMTNDNRMVRWGKIYRSGSFSRMTEQDSLELQALGIKTIIDLRSKDVKKPGIDRYTGVKTIRIPIAQDGYNSISERVMKDEFLRGDAVIYTQDTYRNMINNFADEYAEFFDYLCEPDNYPLVYFCYLGKDQSGLATYFLLKALDVPLDVIEDDYMWSGIGIDKSKLVRNADTLSESKQEAFTMLSNTDLAFLRYGISCIRERSGSVEEYMLHELKITPEKKQRLKSILLY